MEFIILIAIVSIAFSYCSIFYAKLSVRVLELENLCNQIPCVNGGDCIEEAEEMSNDRI